MFEMTVTKKMLIGGHISTAGGIYLSPERALNFSFRTFQIFSKNQMQWKAKPLSPEDVEKFRSEVQERKMKGIMIHASYLLNMATPDQELKAKVLDAFSEEIRRADLLGIDYLTFHPGSSTGTTEKNALKNIADNLNSLITKEQGCTILLETSAGQGKTVGHTFEQLAEIIDQVQIKEKVGICFDTCHVFAAGYDIKSRAGYGETMDKFSSALGLDKLKGFHLNDSKKGLNSRVDRHEQIGDGMLGIDGISNFIRDPRLSEKPMNLETPLGEGGYEKDLAVMNATLNED